MTAEKSCRHVCALQPDLALFTHATLPCVVTWHAWPCVMSRCGWRHMVYDSRLARGILAGSISLISPHLSSIVFLLSFHLHAVTSPPFLLVLSSVSFFLLSNYLYLTQRPSGQHGWPVSCQQSKWGISWPFHCGHQIPSKDSPQWSQNTAAAFISLLPSYSTHWTQEALFHCPEELSL